MIVIGLVRSVSSWIAAIARRASRYPAESGDWLTSVPTCRRGSSAATRAMFRSCVPTESSTSRCWRV